MLVRGNRTKTVFLKACIIAAAVLLCAATAGRAHALGVSPGTPSLHLGVNAGYSSLSGHYGSELDNSVYLGLSFIPFVSRYIFGEMDITYSAYELSGSEGSNLYSTAINAGPLFNLPLFGMMSLYAGILARGNYFYLDTHNLDRQENTFKPGFSARAGMFITLPLGLHLRAGADYSQVWLSGTPFRTLNTYAGISYNLLHVSSADDRLRKETQEKLSRYSQIDIHYSAGVKAFNEGELKSAKENFGRVLSLKNDHPDSRSYMDRIIEMENDYARASELLEKKNYYAAIPYLVKAESNMKEARSELADVRARLAPLVPDMERRGILAYDRNDYELCIDLMNKVKLIDPGNSKVRIYLPRASKRLEALKMLK